jgi:hypothetical protein
MRPYSCVFPLGGTPMAIGPGIGKLGRARRPTRLGRDGFAGGWGHLLRLDIVTWWQRIDQHRTGWEWIAAPLVPRDVIGRTIRRTTPVHSGNGGLRVHDPPMPHSGGIRGGLMDGHKRPAICETGTSLASAAAAATWVACTRTGTAAPSCGGFGRSRSTSIPTSALPRADARR